MKRLLFLTPLLALTGCGAGEIATTGASVAGMFLSSRPAQTAAAAPAMTEERLQDKTRLGAEVGNRMADYFESGKLPTSTSPDTAHPNFCPMVIADLAQLGPMDDGGNALAQGCRIKYHLGKARSAFENHNPAAYDDELDKADDFISQLSSILNRYKGASQ